MHFYGFCVIMVYANEPLFILRFSGITGDGILSYSICYSCVSDIGKCRSLNQDNFICAGKYMDEDSEPVTFPLAGTMTSAKPGLLGIFDGMGGESCGEVASLIASEEAEKLSLTDDPVNDLLEFCKKANEAICSYAEENGVGSMGTTAAMLGFTEKEIALCNIGDSKIYRLADGDMEQISYDHIAVAAYGVKPPLTQNLGIPESEMTIDPYVARGRYNDGDIYLICSDGLTDMLTEDEIKTVLLENGLDDAVKLLLEKALENGGRDNVTIILCRIEKERKGFFRLFFKSKK